jgi:hypothetical protein
VTAGLAQCQRRGLCRQSQEDPVND